jgi:hypothetical protein
VTLEHQPELAVISQTLDLICQLGPQGGVIYFAEQDVKVVGGAHSLVPSVLNASSRGRAYRQ